MLKLTKTLFALGLLLNLSISSAEQAIPNFTATYDVTKAGIALGEMKSEYKVENDNYSYSSTTEPTGIASWFSSETIIETSNGTLTDNNYIPSSYTYKRSGGKKDETTAITFDYDNKIAKNTTDNKTINIQIDSSITDRQIVQVLLMHDMLLKKDNLNYSVINKQEIKPYSFEILNEEVIESALGTFKTTPVVRKRKDSSRETTLWLAHELFYIPIKIKQTKDGSTKFEMEITKLSGIKIPNNQSNSINRNIDPQI